MIDRPDVLIVGAGPAGMQAAVTCSSLGMYVTLLDEQQSPGGQIFRNLKHANASALRILGKDYESGRTLLEKFLSSNVNYVPNARVWQIEGERNVYVSHSGRSEVLTPKNLVLATGAMERPTPAKGWTLPGVIGAGAAQVLLKSSGVVPQGPVVLAGSGPLLYLVCQQFLRLGIKPAAVVDTTPKGNYARAFPYLLGALASWRILAKGLGMLGAIKRAGIPVYSGATDLSFDGTDRVSGVTFNHSGKRHTLSANVVLLSQGVVPDTQITRALRIPHIWSHQQRCWLPQMNDYGELRGTKGIFLAGDAAGIAGAQAAQVRGEIAGWAIAEQRGVVSPSKRDRETSRLFRQLARWRAFRRFLDTLYEPAMLQIVPDDDVLACRCEEVRVGDIRSFVRDGCLGPNQAKAFGRCGMGPCQGRECMLTIAEVIANERRIGVDEIDVMRARFPIKPVSLKDIADIESH